MRGVKLCYNNRMADPQPVVSPSVRLHKRQFAWQILTPILVVTALIVAAAALLASGGAAEARGWADVSIIWIIAPLLAVALLFIAVLGFLIYGVAKLIQVMPRYTAKAQFYTAAAAAVIHKVADGATKPVVWVRQAGAAIKSLFNKP
jgi:hypothetical protein